jgi:hypothetical protein
MSAAVTATGGNLWLTDDRATGRTREPASAGTLRDSYSGHRGGFESRRLTRSSPINQERFVS